MLRGRAGEATNAGCSRRSGCDKIKRRENVKKSEGDGDVMLGGLV